MPAIPGENLRLVPVRLLPAGALAMALLSMALLAIELLAAAGAAARTPAPAGPETGARFHLAMAVGAIQPAAPDPSPARLSELPAPVLALAWPTLGNGRAQAAAPDRRGPRLTAPRRPTPPTIFDAPTLAPPALRDAPARLATAPALPQPLAARPDTQPAAPDLVAVLNPPKASPPRIDPHPPLIRRDPPRLAAPARPMPRRRDASPLAAGPGAPPAILNRPERAPLVAPRPRDRLALADGLDAETDPEADTAPSRTAPAVAPKPRRRPSGARRRAPPAIPDDLPAVIKQAIAMRGQPVPTQPAPDDKPPRLNAAPIATTTGGAWRFALDPVGWAAGAQLRSHRSPPEMIGLYCSHPRVDPEDYVLAGLRPPEGPFAGRLTLRLGARFYLRRARAFRPDARPYWLKLIVTGGGAPVERLLVGHADRGQRFFHADLDATDPLIEALKAGARARVTEEATGARRSYALSGSRAAIDRLIAFCMGRLD